MRKLILISALLPLSGFAERICENSLGFLSVPVSPQSLDVGLYTTWACENTTSFPMGLASIKCRTNGTATIDIFALASDGQLHTVLATPVNCSLDGTSSQFIPYSTYSPGTTLLFKFNVGISTNQVIVIVSEIDKTPAWFTVNFTNQTKITVLGSIHKLGTADLIVQCYSTGSTLRASIPATWVVSELIYDIAISFSSPKTGKCLIR